MSREAAIALVASEVAYGINIQTHVVAIVASTHVQTLNVTDLLCDQGLCPAVIDRLIPTYDGAHLTPQYSAFLAPELETALNLTGSNTVPFVAVPLPSATTTTTISSSN